MFQAHYLEKWLEIQTPLWRSTSRKCHLGYQMVMCLMMSCDTKRLRSCPRYTWMRISGKPLKIETKFQRTTNRKWHMENRMVTWLKFTMVAWRRFALWVLFLVIFTPSPIDRGTGYCCRSISLFICLFVYIFLCFFVSKITRKRLDRFAWNFQQRCGVTVGWPDSILGQIRETARCCDTNFFYIICQHYEQTAGPMCMKLLGKVWTVEWPWDDVIQFLVSSEKPRDAAMRNMGMGFVVLLHHSLLFSVVVCLTGMFSVKKYRLGYVLKDL